MNELVNGQVTPQGDKVAAPFERRYTVAEVAAVCRLSEESVRRAIRSGELTAKRKRHARRTYVVTESELRRWLEDEFEEVVAR